MLQITPTPGDTSWFVHDRFGLFIHWGIYALPGRHEWVGPTGRGEFDQRALDRLSGMGRWMRRHKRSIYGCTRAPEDLKPPADCRYTYNPQTRRLYLHLFAWPFKQVFLEGLAGRVEYAQLLNDASEVKIQMDKWIANQHGAGVDESTMLALELPVVAPDVTVPVVEMFLK